LDVEAAGTVRDWITHLARDERKTIVLTTHEPNALRSPPAMLNHTTALLRCCEWSVRDRLVVGSPPWSEG
jgi:hypothetical protein